MASKAENITKAREHYENRKVGRPIQEWKAILPSIQGGQVCTISKADGHIKDAWAVR